MTTERKHEVSIQGGSRGVRLEELRWLVHQLRHASGDSLVDVYKDPGTSQLDPGYVKLTATVPDDNDIKIHLFNNPANPVTYDHPPGARGAMRDQNKQLGRG